jgi:hypothetical protein
MRDGAKVRLSEMERRTVKDFMRAELMAQARLRQLITYGELARRLPVRIHPHSFVFTRLLQEVCGEALRAGHGQLCALVVSKATGMPSGGYFTGLAGLGRDHADLEALWQADLEALYALWNEA